MPPPQCQPFPEEGICQREVMAMCLWPSCCVIIAWDLVGIWAVGAEPVWPPRPTAHMLTRHPVANTEFAYWPSDSQFSNWLAHQMASLQTGCAAASLQTGCSQRSRFVNWPPEGQFANGTCQFAN